MESLGEVDLGEPFGSMEVVKQLICAGQGISVLDGLGIQSTVIDDHSQ